MVMYMYFLLIFRKNQNRLELRSTFYPFLLVMSFKLLYVSHSVHICHQTQHVPIIINGISLQFVYTRNRNWAESSFLVMPKPSARLFACMNHSRNTYATPKNIPEQICYTSLSDLKFKKNYLLSCEETWSNPHIWTNQYDAICVCSCEFPLSIVVTGNSLWNAGTLVEFSPRLFCVFVLLLKNA